MIFPMSVYLLFIFRVSFSLVFGFVWLVVGSVFIFFNRKRKDERMWEIRKWANRKHSRMTNTLFHPTVIIPYPCRLIICCFISLKKCINSGTWLNFEQKEYNNVYLTEICCQIVVNHMVAKYFHWKYLYFKRPKKKYRLSKEIYFSFWRFHYMQFHGNSSWRITTQNLD